MLLPRVYILAMFLAFLCIHWALARRPFIRNILLLAFSLFLYGVWSGMFVVLLVSAILVSYVGAFFLVPGQRFRKVALMLLIFTFLGLLCFFKYVGFFIDGLMPLLRHVGVRPDALTEHLLVPLGLSFIVFQILAYFFEVYAGRLQPTRGLVSHALLVAFFPKIASGPIEQPGQLIEQFKKPLRFRSALLSEAIFLITWGAIEKFCIADNVGIIGRELFVTSPTVSLITGALAVTLQIFADFSGYSNMAKGVAALLGFELSWNFNIPYISGSPSEFWKRWHISLSQWFQRYVYIPLGGNRRGSVRTAVNLLVTMTLVGFWHGAQWTFVAWGFYQGFLLVVYRIFAPEKRGKDQSASLLAIALFFCLTMAGWVMFQAPTFHALIAAAQAIAINPFHISLLFTLLLWLPVILMQTLQYRRKDLLAVAHLPLHYQLSFYFIAYYMLMYLPPLEPQRFIYVQF
jgi:D-alanyl-lipoteichoic acid acyltransferase DltB (MBOAT superfamily)